MDDDPFELANRHYKRTLQQRGQLTIPKRYRKRMDLEPGDELVLQRQDDDTLLVIPPEE